MARAIATMRAIAPGSPLALSLMQHLGAAALAYRVAYLTLEVV